MLSFFHLDVSGNISKQKSQEECTEQDHRVLIVLGCSRGWTVKATLGGGLWESLEELFLACVLVLICSIIFKTNLACSVAQGRFPFTHAGALAFTYQ